MLADRWTGWQAEEHTDSMIFLRTQAKDSSGSVTCLSSARCNFSWSLPECY